MKIISIYKCILLGCCYLLLGCEPQEVVPITPNVAIGLTSLVGSESFKAHWKPFPSADYYLLEVALDLEFKELISETYPLTVQDTAQIVRGLLPETRYYFRVAAFTLAGTYVDYSVPTLVETLKLGKPHAYDPLEQDINQVIAAWSPIAEAERYQLELAQDIHFERIVRTYEMLGHQDTVQVMDSLFSNRNYFYRVRSAKGDFTSDDSNIILASTTTLLQPSMQEPLEIAYTSASLAWSTDDIVDSYHLQLSTDPLFAETEAIIFDLELTANNLELPDLEPNTVYYTRVKSRLDTLFSMYSEVMSFQTLTLDAPAGLSMAATAPLALELTWEAVADAESYEIDLSEDSLFRSITTTYDAVSTTAQLMTFTDLSPGTTYYVRVRSFGFGAYSVNSLTQASTLTLAMPENPNLTNRTLEGFTLNWDDVAGAGSYLLDIATDPDFNNLLTAYAEKELLQTSTVISGLSAEVEYYLRLRSKFQHITSEFSDPVVVTAAVPQSCLINNRLWQDGWSETYQFTNGQLVQITGDSANVNTTQYRWDLEWESDGTLAAAELYQADAGGILLLEEHWEYTYTAGSWSSLTRRDTTSTVLEWIRLSYEANGRLARVESFIDESASVLNYEENYSYQDGQITEARDDSDVLVRSWKYKGYYNPEKRFSPELLALIRKPSKSGIWGYVPAEVISVYQNFTLPETQRQTFVYEKNNLGIPIKMYSGQDQTTLTYNYQSCGF